jgi:hypothetical protein
MRRKQNWHECKSISDYESLDEYPGKQERFTTGSKSDLEEILRKRLQFGTQVKFVYTGTDKMETAFIYFSYQMEHLIARHGAEGIVNITYLATAINDKNNKGSSCLDVYLIGNLVYDKEKKLDKSRFPK